MFVTLLCWWMHAKHKLYRCFSLQGIVKTFIDACFYEDTWPTCCILFTMIDCSFYEDWLKRFIYAVRHWPLREFWASASSWMCWVTWLWVRTSNSLISVFWSHKPVTSLAESDGLLLLRAACETKDFYVLWVTYLQAPVFTGLLCCIFAIAIYLQ